MQSRTSLIVVTALITAIATSLIWLAGIGLIYWHFMSSSPPFAVTVDAPREVMLGETVNLQLKVSNPTDEKLQLGSVDIYDSLLDGFEVVEVDPEPAERSHNFDFLTFYFSKSLAAGETFPIRVAVKAAKEGVWTGDVDFCTPSEKFVTSSVTMRVKPAAGP